MKVVTERNRKWWILGAVTASLFMTMLDVTVVNVGLPSIGADIDATLTELEWVVNSYLLVYAVLLLSGGKLADFLGRRRIFLLGLAVFTLASLACGLAGTGELLIAARAAQGLGAALMLPATQGIIAATFAPEERGMAFGIWAAVSGLGLALGPLIGGLLIQGIDWRWIFYINIPFGLLAFVVARLIIPESRDTAVERRLDVPGLLASGAMLFALTFALVEGQRYGWTSNVILGCFIAAGVALIAFIVLQLRGRVPLVDLSLFRNPTFAGANIASLLIMLGMVGVLFFVSIYMQHILGYSAVETGAGFLALTVPFMLVAPLSGKLTDRLGPRWPITVGMTLIGVGLLLLARLGIDTTYREMVPAFIVAGIGIGLAMPPGTTTVIATVAVDKSSVASGVVNTFRQTGGAFGVAIMGAIVAAEIGGTLSGEALAGGDPAFAISFVAGYQNALVVGAAFVLTGAAIALVTLRRPQPLEEEELRPVAPEAATFVPAAATFVPEAAFAEPEPVEAIAMPGAPEYPRPDSQIEVFASESADSSRELARSPEPATVPTTMGSLPNVLRSELEPLAQNIEGLQTLFASLLKRVSADRRERIDDLELLTELIIEGWRGVDRRLGRLEKTIQRIEAQLPERSPRRDAPTVIQFNPRAPEAQADGDPAAADDRTERVDPGKPA